MKYALCLNLILVFVLLVGLSVPILASAGLSFRTTDRDDTGTIDAEANPNELCEEIPSDRVDGPGLSMWPVQRRCVVIPTLNEVLDPDARYTGLVQCSGPDCSFCTVVAMANSLVQWLIGFVLVLSVALFVYAGYRIVMSGDSAEGVTFAKKLFQNVIIGLLIILSAWLIVDTIMRILVKDSALGRPWNEIQCVPATPLVDYQPRGYVENLTLTAAGQPVSANEGDRRRVLANAGVPVNNRACPEGASFRNVTGGCTNVGSLTIDSIKSAATLAGRFPIMITGGSEDGHQNACHKAGTCYDVVLTDGNYSLDRLQSFSSEVAATGCSATYEPTTNVCPAGIECQGVSVTRATGVHFSIYCDR